MPYDVPLTVQPKDQIARLPSSFLGKGWKVDESPDSSYVIHRVSCGVLTIETCIAGAPLPELEGAQWRLVLEVMRARPEYKPRTAGNRFSATILIVRNDFDAFIQQVNAGLPILAGRLQELQVALDRPVVYCEPVAGGTNAPLTALLEGTGFALI